MQACMHNGLLDACLYAPLPCVNATWHWQEGPSTTTMWTAADPASAGEKARLWASLLTLLSSFRSRFIYAWWGSFLQILPPTPLFTSDARKAYGDIIHKQVWVCGEGVSYSYRRRKVRKPRKCFPTLQGYLLPFLFFNSSYNVSS